MKLLKTCNLYTSLSYNIKLQDTETNNLLWNGTVVFSVVLFPALHTDRDTYSYTFRKQPFLTLGEPKTDIPTSVSI